MSLKDKYSALIDYARNPRINNLNITEQNNVLYISGSANKGDKDKLWDMYNKIDPDMRSGDLVMKIDTIDSQANNNDNRIYEVKSGDSLSLIATKYPNLSWQDIYEANKDIIKDPDIIRPGQKLKIPVK